MGDVRFLTAGARANTCANPRQRSSSTAIVPAGSDPVLAMDSDD